MRSYTIPPVSCLSLFAKYTKSMAIQPVGENTVLEWSSYVCGHHICSQIWTPTIGEILSLQNEPDNSHNQFSVAVIENSVVVVTFLELSADLSSIFEQSWPHRHL